MMARKYAYNDLQPLREYLISQTNNKERVENVNVDYVYNLNGPEWL